MDSCPRCSDSPALLTDPVPPRATLTPSCNKFKSCPSSRLGNKKKRGAFAKWPAWEKEVANMAEARVKYGKKKLGLKRIKAVPHVLRSRFPLYLTY